MWSGWGHRARKDQTLPSGQLGSVNSIFVGLSRRSSHFRSHSNRFIQNPLKSLLCFPGSGSFSYIYIYLRSLAGTFDRGQCASWQIMSHHRGLLLLPFVDVKIKKWSTCSQVPCFRRAFCCVPFPQLFLSLGAGFVKEVASSASLAAAQDVLLQL